ncbi:MAG: protoporphyrinogen oxidase HemJ [Alphaproteobacteria bacterium]|jgi:putative membrane protein|nr:TIGR00701 family protein [Rhodospirillaceae bacterium]MDP6660722.1 protoporphyrinogen oxidase HemJ [Alphaproteobacteria bacterium]MDP6780906.1 protoporphyrinogen oxidase HemJ [Alphaproteobacteria bacterium]MDP7044577.1 protoporphyrinogen oxidase HemJ [Alphaproteobacteria bacterium]|tara:strand:- start:490 stop:939 length:450 start_codon:yes stop_codon:yes gene_type:complete
MTAFLSEAYPWTRALHIIAVISWMAALLYLPRLYVYHCGAEPGSGASEMLKTMERRLLKAIMTPAMVVSLLTGIFLLYTPDIVDWSTTWIYLKLVFVGGLLLFHGLLARWRRGFEADANRRPARFYRIANEVPALLMVAIVIMVVVRPF